jgi:signal transduction histidine kinase
MRVLNESELRELKTEFRKLSHDVRSPLTSILGLADLTRDDASLSDDARENLSLIVSDAERLTAMMTTKLDEIDARFFADDEGRG